MCIRDRISDSYRIQLNGKPAKLFRSGSLTLLELLMMNGYSYEDQMCIRDRCRARPPWR